MDLNVTEVFTNSMGALSVVGLSQDIGARKLAQNIVRLRTKYSAIGKSSEPPLGILEIAQDAMKNRSQKFLSVLIQGQNLGQAILS